MRLQIRLRKHCNVANRPEKGALSLQREHCNDNGEFCNSLEGHFERVCLVALEISDVAIHKARGGMKPEMGEEVTRWGGVGLGHHETA